jgi:hypothetical protein
MNTVTAEIDVTKPIGRRIVRTLENNGCVKIHYPFKGKSENTFTHEEVFRSAEKVLNDYFKTDFRLDI